MTAVWPPCLPPAVCGRQRGNTFRLLNTDYQLNAWNAAGAGRAHQGPQTEADRGRGAGSVGAPAGGASWPGQPRPGRGGPKRQEQAAPGSHSAGPTVHGGSPGRAALCVALRQELPSPRCSRTASGTRPQHLRLWEGHYQTGGQGPDGPRGKALSVQQARARGCCPARSLSQRHTWDRHRAGP